MLQKRAQHRLERASEKRYRSPGYNVARIAFVVVVMGLLLLGVDKGVKVTYRIIQIWSPVIFDAKKPPPPKPQPGQQPAANVDKPFMVKVEPGNQSSSGQSSASDQSAAH